MSESEPVRWPPVAVVGVSALYPGRPGKAGFWQDILAGADNIGDVPPSHWLIEDYYDPDPAAPDKTYAKRGGFISPSAFDPLEFGIPPKDLPSTDTAQLLALVVAKQVLKEACATQFHEIDRKRTSVILGVASTTELVVQLGGRLQRPVWVKALREEGLPESQVQAICDRIAENYVPWQESSFPGLLGNVVAGRIANRLDLGGSNYVTDAACASSLSAIQAGINELFVGQSDLVIAGGVDALNDILMYMCFSKTPAFSATGDCRPFSDNADGTIIGEGVGMLALRRLEDAERDGNTIYAVIRGVGASSDGRSMSVYAPRWDGQAAALRRAYQAADYAPRTVELVEAHGTGTVAGDAAEVRGLSSVFEDASGHGARWCALGSIKSQIGHTKAAAGAAGLIKAVLALHHKVLPPTIKVDRPNAALNLETSPFYINTAARPWIRGSDHPRRASVSSFGFGGSNFHVTVEEYIGSGPSAPKVRALSCELFLLSAATPRDLVDACHRLGGTARDEDFSGASRASQEAFDAKADQRLAIIAESSADLRNKLETAAARLDGTSRPGRLAPGVHYAAGAPEQGRVAFLFPGQGSQYVGMGARLAMAFDAAREVWDCAADVFQGDGAPLHGVVFPPPAFSDEERAAQMADLTRMANAQPAIAAASLSQLAMLRRLGVTASAVAGHSFGEVTALHAAGAFGLAETLKIARRRGELMTEAADGSEGGMLAVQAGREIVADWLGKNRLELVVANDNGPGQVVVSGALEVIDKAHAMLGKDGFAVSRLPVATAFHSPVVAGSREPFHEFLSGVQFGAPSLDVFANATAAPYPREAAEMRRQLADQLASPVRFRETVEAMYEAGVRVFIEVGPASVLTGLVGSCLEDRTHCAIALDRKGGDGIQSFWNALGRMSVLGLDLDYAPLWEGFAVGDGRAAPAPAHAVQILGSNFGKRYPPAEGVSALPAPNAERLAPESLPAATREAPSASRHSAPGAPDQWLAALDSFQRHTTETQRHFQTVMAQSHQAYLKTVESALRAMGGEVPSEGVPDWPMPTRQAEQNLAYEPMPAPGELPHSAEPHGSPAPLKAPSWDDPPLPPRSEAAPAPDAPVGSGQTGGESVSIADVLLQVVAEKTGYPREMLGLDMELEAELGIDSIKQVEILSALRDHRPDLREIDPGMLAQLKTLGQIVAFAQGPGDAEAAVPANVQTVSNAMDRSAAAEPVPLVHHVPVGVEATASGFTLAGLFEAGHVAVVPDDRGIAEAVIEALRLHGVSAAPWDGADPASAVIHLGALSRDDRCLSAGDLHWQAVEIAQAVLARHGEGAPCLVTVQDTGGAFGLDGATGDFPQYGGLPALLKTFMAECPRATGKAIDIAVGAIPAKAVADRIMGELLQGGADAEVGLGPSGQRISVSLRPSSDAHRLEKTLYLADGDVVVVSGGARGVAAATLKALANKVKLKLLLLGRSTLEPEPEACRGAADDAAVKLALLAQSKTSGESLTPEALGRRAAQVLACREAEETLAVLRRAGSVVKYRPLDVADAAAVHRVIAEARAAWGPVKGVIHAAGVLADKPILHKTRAQFDPVFRTKVDGFDALMSATRDDPLRLICVFSSIAARNGNAGQCDYAMANEVLNKLARAEATRRRGGCVVRSINWGPWDGGMVGSSLKQHFERLGVGLISRDAGAAFFLDEISVPQRGEVEIVAAAGIPSVPPRNWRVGVVVGGTTHPYLADHAINGRPVLPMVLVIEWFMRFGRSLMPGLTPVSLDNIRALKGIVLDDFPAPQRFEIRAQPAGTNGTARIALELCCSAGQVRYAAELQMGIAPNEGNGRDMAAVRTDLSSWPYDQAEIYDGKLFHGPRFQVVRKLEGWSGSRATGLLDTTLRMRWPGGPWSTDPLALDGGMQLGLLWGMQQTGQQFLPSRIGAFIQYSDDPADGPLRCLLDARMTGAARMESDLSFATLDGRVVAELRGLEMCGIEAPARHGGQ